MGFFSFKVSRYIDILSINWNGNDKWGLLQLTPAAVKYFALANMLYGFCYFRCVKKSYETPSSNLGQRFFKKKKRHVFVTWI